MLHAGEGVRIFATIPPSNRVDPAHYLRNAIDVARWSDAAGLDGALIYTDNGLLDPWAVAQAVIAHTDRFSPLVAVQPVYMHPYSVAKLVASVAHLYERRVFLNLVAGGFVNDLKALDDDTEHDRRYDRLVEYGHIIDALAHGEVPLTFEGRWYRVRGLRLAPALDPELRPGFTVSGSSEAGITAARTLGATAIQYPRPPGQYEGRHELDTVDMGIRIGLLGREDPVEAWRLAWARFPADPRGQLTHRLAMRVSDSVWHRQLSALAELSASSGQPYWLHPFENYQTFCPYLVGSWDEVARVVADYLDLGFRTFITDVPAGPDDLDHIGIVFERAQKLVAV
jgi:alkanesulfonate monooxygenase